MPSHIWLTCFPGETLDEHLHGYLVELECVPLRRLPAPRPPLWTVVDGRNGDGFAVLNVVIREGIAGDPLAVDETLRAQIETRLKRRLGARPAAEATIH